MVVADVNGDGYDDIVALDQDADGVGIDVYLNEGKARAEGEDVTFIKTRLLLKGHANADFVTDHVKVSSGGDLQVVDLDNDGHPDILASTTGTGEIYVLWNQPNLAMPYEYVPDASDGTAPSMTFFSPLAMDATFGVSGNALGSPIYLEAANLGDGSGRKSIVAYHGGLQTDATSKDRPPFNQRNYEAMAILYPNGARGFDIVTQRRTWPGCDLSFGGGPGCVGWNDGMPAGTSLFNFRMADGARLNFTDAASDILAMDGWATVNGTSFYQPATLRPNASIGLQVLLGHGVNGSDAVWLEGGGQMNEFVADFKQKMMRRRNVVPAVEGNERSAAGTFMSLSTGANALITAGGMDVYYDPENPASVVKQPVPDALNRAGQIGGWLRTMQLDDGPALAALSDLCRSPDPCVADTSWNHLPLDGSAPPAATWDSSHSLLMLQYAAEVSAPSGRQFAPFFQDFEDAHFQAFSLMTGSIDQKPQILSGHFASSSEQAIVVLDHVDGTADDPMYTHLALYRPDTAKTYASPVPHLDGLTVGRFIADGLSDIGNTLPKGEHSAVLVGTQLGVGIRDGIRYVTVYDKATHAAKGIFPVYAAETIKDLHKDGVVVPGLSTLDIGQYTLDVRNANASASMELKVVNPFGITMTDYDWSAGRACGLLPNTKDGDLWPKQIAVTVTDFPGADQLQGVRWIKRDGTAVDLGSEYARYDAANQQVVLIIPQDGSLSDGYWRPFIKANGVWQEVPRSWNVAHDSASLATCAQRVNFVNEEAYAQCTNDDYYLDPAQYKVWPHLANGSLRFFGSGFVSSHIQSAALKQGNHRFLSKSLNVVGDNEIDVNFGDLSDTATPDVDLDLYFYSELGDVVESEGVPASGGKVSWRTVRKGSCVPQMPQITGYLNTGSGDGGTFLSGDTIQVSGKNILYPVPSATKLVLKGDDGSLYLLENPRLPDDWDSHHYDNDNLVLYFTVPDDLDSVKISDGSSGSGTTHLSGGLVVAGSGALATTAVSEAGLTALLSNPVSAFAVVGETALGVSIYYGTHNAIWLYEKVRMLTTKTPSPTDITKPGQSVDDQPEDQKNVYAISFVSQPLALDDIGPADFVVVRDVTATAALVKARLLAIPNFMMTNYSVFGTVEGFGSGGQLPSLYAAAGDTSVHFVGPPGTNPIGKVFEVAYPRFGIEIKCDFLPTIRNSFEAGVDVSMSSELWRSTAVWRRNVWTKLRPPLCENYSEGITNYVTYRSEIYVIDARNDYRMY